MSDITFEEARQAFLRSLPPSKNRTAATYATAMDRFADFLENSGNENLTADTPLVDFPESILLDFYVWLDKRGYSGFTRNTYLAGLRKFLTFHYLARNLNASFDLIRAKEMLGRTRLHYPQTMPPEEVPEVVRYYDQQLLPEPDGSKSRQRARLCLLRDRAIVHTLFCSAGRVSEVAGLTRDNVKDGRSSEVLITGKGDKDRWLYLTPQAQAAIQAYLAERPDKNPGLFISHGRGKGARLSTVSIWRVVKQAAEALDLNDISPHTFRHWRATQMLNDGVPLEIIQELLGHSDIGTTRKVYAKSRREKVRDEFFKHVPDI